MVTLGMMSFTVQTSHFQGEWKVGFDLWRCSSVADLSDQRWGMLMLANMYTYIDNYIFVQYNYVHFNVFAVYGTWAEPVRELVKCMFLG